MLCRMVPLAALLCWLLTAWNRASEPLIIHQEDLTLHEFGSDESALLTLPAHPPRAGILLLPNARGARAVVEERALLLARLGFLCLALDPYDGQDAGTPEEAEAMERRLDPRRVSGAVSAALRLILDSPRYRCPAVLIAAWGPHGAALPASLQDRPGDPRLLLISLLEPDPGTVTDLIQHRLPLQFVVRQQMVANYPRLPGDSSSCLVFDAEPGFLLTERQSPIAFEAWATLFESWTRRVDLQGKKAPDSNVPGDEVRSSPAADAAHPSRLIRRSR